MTMQEYIQNKIDDILCTDSQGADECWIAADGNRGDKDNVDQEWTWDDDLWQYILRENIKAIDAVIEYAEKNAAISYIREEDLEDLNRIITEYNEKFNEEHRLIGE